MTPAPSAPPGAPVSPVRYGPGLAVLVVGTGTEPFTSTPAPVRLHGGAVPVVLVDSGSPAVPPAGASTLGRSGVEVGRRDGDEPDVAPPGLVWTAGALG